MLDDGIESLEKEPSSFSTLSGAPFEIRGVASSFVYACLKNGYTAEAEDFIEWYYEAFNDELED